MVCLSKVKLPTREECYNILEEYNVPRNIVRHCEIVNKVSVFLAKKLKESGLDVDVDLVDRASLLHDLDKLQTLENGEHGLLTEDILTKKSYPMLGKVAKQHRFKYIHDPYLSWEAKIVNYADTRVLNDKIISIKERLADLRKRYKVKPKVRDKEAERLFRELEKDIFSRIGLKPKDLEKYVK